MSIKKLFEAADKSRNYLAETNEKNAFKDVESVRNVEQIAIKQQTFVPQIDYADPENFAKFGSAYYYYSGALGRIVDYYPYDGSDAEQNEFYNKSLDVEKYIFNNLFPRVNGYANFNSSSYIDFKGGPHGIVYKKVADLFDNPLDSKRHAANVYDTNIYQTAGLPDSYGTGSRESNLRANFSSGVTVEFWLKSRRLAAGASQVVFDMWNNNASGAVDMGRLTIETLSASSGTPFRYTVQSGSMTSGTPGSGTIFQQSVGQTVTSETLSDWNHYAFVFQNSGSSFVTKFYLNGYLNDTSIKTDLAIGDLDSKDMVARIGGLVTRPFKPDGTTDHIPAAAAHTLTGSVDEFRFWKAARDGKEIGSNWFSQVRGGTNTDISNTTLGVYYKFNEGTSGYGYLDKNVLDYSGRLTNGTWTGTPSRTLSSAIIEASAANSEYKDPIIYASHPEVVDLRNGLLSSGSFHDKNNTSNLKTLMPSWILEEHETLGNKNPELISHILGTYFDKIYAQIEAIPSFRHQQYTSASATPLPFAEHLPQSLGLYTPQLFVDSDVVSKFMNKTEDFAFAGDIVETKNLIYLNLYNNLANIYKTKGTEKSIRNIMRCFNLNDTIVSLRTYLDNNVYELDQRLPRLKQVLTSKKALYFNTSSHINATCFQFQDPDDTTGTRGYISGSGVGGYENIYGFTAEADITLPTFNMDYDSVDRNFNQVSIFGMYTASTEAPDTLTWPAFDGCNFQVYAVRERKYSKNVFFMLTSSYRPSDASGDTPWENPSVGPIPILTSSVFFDAYDNTDWNLSVRMKPSNFESPLVSGSDIGYTYDLVFQGVNTKLGTIENTFVLTASIPKSTGHDFLSGSKRMYVGANRKDFTGQLNYQSDVRMFNTRYWAKYIDDDSLKQHIYDFDNAGISGSYKNISSLDPNNEGYDILNRNMLVLDWNFNDVTSSDGTGNFLTQDMSSGSAQIRRAYGWVGGLSGYKHTGRGHGFKINNSSVSKDWNINTFKFIHPEDPISSDMINILTEDDQVFGFAETVPNFHHKLEKSMYAAISDEMLNFFAGVIDFNNIIGEPVNRYRSRYKKLEKLREAFFRRVTKTSHVEDYIKYYQWFDDALSYVVGQLVPAANKFSEDVLDIVESHALERNKYKSQFPTIEFKLDDPITPILGINERLYNWKYNHAPLSMSLVEAPSGSIPGVGGPLSGSEIQQVNSRWWRDRAERFESDISSVNNVIDQQRDIYRETIENDNNQKLNILVTLTNGVHSGSSYVLRKLSKPYKLTAYRNASPTMPVRGGVNFEQTKKIDLTYNSLRPAGPINESASAYIPENVLFANIFDSTDGKELDIVKLKDSTDPEYDPFAKPFPKIYRHLKVQHGRDWEYGMGYKSIKSDFAFPFNVVSSSVNTGYNRLVQFQAMSGVMITNLHNDVYGPDMESPMQGPFTNYAVGGHQSRHVALNKGSDTWKTRPEAWRILLGKCDDPFVRGAIGMVGPDYPQANASSGTAATPPYPATASQKAVYYRGFVAKRPVNIRNIHHTTGSTILGNYEHNYQVVQAPGGRSNPRQFSEKQPNLPTTLFSGFFGPGQPSQSQATSVRTLLDIYRGAVNGVYNAETASVAPGTTHMSGHFDFSADYSTDYLQGGLHGLSGSIVNNSVITSKFSHRGGIEVMTRGYQDFRSGEFSVYNMLNNRNLTVKRPFQSHPLVSGAAEEDGIRVYDIHGNDYGHTIHAARHTERFFRDSILVPNNQGATYDEKPAFHRVHRNNLPRPKLATENYVLNFGGDYLQNDKQFNYGSMNFNTTLLATDQNDTFQKVERYLVPAITGAGGPGRSHSQSGGSGFTWTGWMKFASKNNNVEEGIWRLGLCQGNNALISLDKRHTDANGYSIHFKVRGTDGAGAGTNEYIWKTIIDSADDENGISDLTSSMVHVALVWGTPNDGTNISFAPANGTLEQAHSAACLYINGVSQSVTSFDLIRTDYHNLNGTKANFRSHSGLTISGSTFFSLGGGVTDNVDPISASVDEYTFWSVALDSGSIQEIYNRGIPCDITASTLYGNSGSFLFDWIRFDSGSVAGVDNNYVGIESTNPGTYNATANAVRGFLTSSWIPMGVGVGNDQTTSSADLAGCTQVFLGISASIAYSCSNFYDNLNHYHQIPRSDRQYAWMTGAMLYTDPCNYRYAGFMPIFHTNAGLYSSSTGFEPWLTMLSESEFGVFNQGGWAPDTVAFGAVKGGSEQDQSIGNFYGQDFAGLNTIIYEPITSSTNTLGWTFNVPMFALGGDDPHQYRNKDLVGYVGTPRGIVSHSMAGAKHLTDGVADAYLFNLLMLKRNGPYGYGTHAQFRRNPNHPVLRNERSSSEISVITHAERNPVTLEIIDGPFGPVGSYTIDYSTTIRSADVTNYTLPPVSMRGRPALFNFTPFYSLDDCGEVDVEALAPYTVTLKITDNNEKIFFNSYGLNTHTNINEYGVITPLDHAILAFYTDEDLTDPNWFIYTENVFPSQRMEFVSSSRRRTNYDNLYWRDIRADRDTLGFTMENSIGATVSQSSWPLDAMSDFLTRTASYQNENRAGAAAGASFGGPATAYSGQRRSSGSGELQNVYTQFYYDAYRRGDFAPATIDSYASYLLAQYQLAPGALLARKHMIPAPRSVVAPSGMEIPETGSNVPRNTDDLQNVPFKPYMREKIQINAGEALWEAGEHAGIIQYSMATDGTTTKEFKSYKSEPWYDNYQDFREDIRLMAKDYVILPEFRMHNHVERFLNAESFETSDTLYEIPGTGLFSTTSSFYRDYMNSERFKFFRDVDTKIKNDYLMNGGDAAELGVDPMDIDTLTAFRLHAREIMIKVEAVKKFNPYKGFYPAQRTLDLSHQFAKVYYPNIETKWGYWNDTAETEFRSYSLSSRNNFHEFLTRPIAHATFCPGIMYNSIKSGIAVDYPTMRAQIAKVNVTSRFGMGQSVDGHTSYEYDPAYVMSTRSAGALAGTGGPPKWAAPPYPDESVWNVGDNFYDLRLPFETMIKPAEYLLGEQLADMEPHPSCSLPYTASLTVDGDRSYELMARNFFGETANFFLQNRDFSAFQSAEIETAGIPIVSGTMYGMRMKMRRSLDKPRDYSKNFNSLGYRDAVMKTGHMHGGCTGRSNLQTASMGTVGGMMLWHNSGSSFPGLRFKNTQYPLPQDPFARAGQTGSQCRENFTMYSRPTAFGPPIAVGGLAENDSGSTAGRPADNYPRGYARKRVNYALNYSASLSGTMDCFHGFNWPYTPPYYHGEAWADFLFFPSETKNYSVTDILKEMEVVYWRVDPGPIVKVDSGNSYVPAHIWDYSSSTATWQTKSWLGGGRTINGIAMQLSASFNMFGIQKTPFTAFGPELSLLEERNETKAERWVIKPKWETPMLNFNDQGLRGVTAASGTLTVPIYASASVPRGMWHQFGLIETDPQKGIFMELGNIPKSWLSTHWQVVNEASIYNKYNPGIVSDPESNGNQVAGKMRSLNEIFNFPVNSRKLGQLNTSTTVKEAVVVIPYYIENWDKKITAHPEDINDNNLRNAKHFIELDPDKVQASIMANRFTDPGMDLDVAGESVRKLINKMDRYILPPEFDFLRNPDTTPIVMYIFEFSHTFDKNDLSYIWQNLAPRDYKKLSFETQSVAHKLDDTELISKDLLFEDHFEGQGSLRFMAFKVKQKAVGDYYTHVLEQVPRGGSALGTITGIRAQDPGLISNTRFEGIGINLGGDEGPAPAFGFAPSQSPEAEWGILTPEFQPWGYDPGGLSPASPPTQKYEVQYNWPYDYLSIIEGVKIDVSVLWDDVSNISKSLLHADLAPPDPSDLGSAVEGILDSTMSEATELMSAPGTAGGAGAGTSGLMRQQFAPQGLPSAAGASYSRPGTVSNSRSAPSGRRIRSGTKIKNY